MLMFVEESRRDGGGGGMRVTKQHVIVLLAEKISPCSLPMDPSQKNKIPEKSRLHDQLSGLSLVVVVGGDDIPHPGCPSVCPDASIKYIESRMPCI